MNTGPAVMAVMCAGARAGIDAWSHWSNGHIIGGHMQSFVALRLTSLH